MLLLKTSLFLFTTSAVALVLSKIYYITKKLIQEQRNRKKVAA